MRPLLLFLILLVALAPIADGRPRPQGSFGKCHVSRHATVLAAGKRAVVVLRHEQDQVFHGCVRHLGRWYVVGEVRSRPELLKVKGTKAAAVQRFSYGTDSVEGPFRELTVTDLTTGEIRTEIYFSGDGDGDADGPLFPFARVKDMVLGSSRRLAFIWTAGDTSHVVRLTPHLISVLDEGASVAPRSLTRAGTKVCWLRGGRRRCSAFSHAP
jgi:hypothetical protein